MTREEACSHLRFELAALERACKYKHYMKDTLSLAIQVLEEPERVHAHWIDSALITRCSHCESAFSLSYGQFNFCPNCGAIMDEETNC